MTLGPLQIAAVAYAANRAYAASLGEHPPPWGEIDRREQRLWAAAVLFHVEHPGATPDELQEEWLRLEREAGWGYGPALDNATRRHPHHVPWDGLAPEHKVKVVLIRDVIAAIVALTPITTR